MTRTFARVRFAAIQVAVVAGAVGLAASPAAAGGNRLRPFLLTGTTTSARQADCTTPGTTVCTITASGPMRGTLVGSATIDETAVVRFDQPTSLDPACFATTTTATVTAANGDTLLLAGQGVTCPAPPVVTFRGTYSIAAGSGRFAGASGGGVNAGITTDGQHIDEVRAGTIRL